MVCSEATTGGVLQKKVFLEISQNSQENNFSYRTVSCLRLLSQESVVNKMDKIFMLTIFNNHFINHLVNYIF